MNKKCQKVVVVFGTIAFGLLFPLKIALASDCCDTSLEKEKACGGWTETVTGLCYWDSEAGEWVTDECQVTAKPNTVPKVECTFESGRATFSYESFTCAYEVEEPEECCGSSHSAGLGGTYYTNATKKVPSGSACPES